MMAILFSSYIVLAISLSATSFAHETTTPLTPTNAAEHCLESLGSEWDTYTVLRPSTTQLCSKLEEKIDQLQKNVNAIMALVNQTDLEDPVSEDNQIYKDCQDIYLRGLYEGDGEYLIHPEASNQPFFVYCELDPEGEGVWTVIQKRMDGEESFDRDWADYKTGFGPTDGNHWLGNQRIHELTFSGLYALRINLSDWEGNLGYADYSGFYLEGESDNYRLRFRSYSAGNVGDSLSFQKDMEFSTKDNDNDLRSDSCITLYGAGGWWYNNCFHSKLNGKYNPSSVTSNYDGIIWLTWKSGGGTYSLKTTTMKIKPMNF